MSSREGSWKPHGSSSSSVHVAYWIQAGEYRDGLFNVLSLGVEDENQS